MAQAPCPRSSYHQVPLEPIASAQRYPAPSQAFYLKAQHAVGHADRRIRKKKGKFASSNCTAEPIKWHGQFLSRGLARTHGHAPVSKHGRGGQVCPLLSDIYGIDAKPQDYFPVLMNAYGYRARPKEKRRSEVPFRERGSLLGCKGNYRASTVEEAELHSLSNTYETQAFGHTSVRIGNRRTCERATRGPQNHRRLVQ